MQPFDLVVDPAARRAYLSAHSAPAVAIMNLDTGEFIESLVYDRSPLDVPRLAVDQAGVVYLTSFAESTFLRIEPGNHARRWIASGERGLRSVIGLETGFAAVVVRAGQSFIVVFSTDGRLLQEAEVADGTLTIMLLDGGARLGAFAPDGTLARYDLSTLAPLEACDLGFPAVSGAQLDDGTIVVANQQGIGLAGCAGEPPQFWRIGVDNQDVVSLGNEALVLDRKGDGGRFDPNFGVARVVNSGGVVPSRSFVTEKNSGFGGYDPSSQRVWVNSEGTSEACALDPAAGTILCTAVGEQLDGVAIDSREGHRGQLVLTGRLANLLTRLEQTGSPAATAPQREGIRWPYSPVIDADRNRLYVLSQTEMAVYVRDVDSLAAVDVFPLGLGPNTRITFGTVALHSARGTLLVTHPDVDALVELSAVSGEILHVFPLGGPALPAEEQIGDLQLLVNAEGDVFVIRTPDSRVQRVELPFGVTRTEWVDAALDARVSVGMLDDEKGLLYLGGTAVSQAELSRAEAEDYAVTRLIGPDPDRAGGWYAEGRDEKSVVRLDESGAIVAERRFADVKRTAGRFALNPDDRSVVLLRSQSAVVCEMPFEAL